jgi:hypothetical protein
VESGAPHHGILASNLVGPEKSPFRQVRLEVAGEMGRYYKPADFDLAQYLKVWGLLWGVPAWKGL